jgi:hypothetical protein
MEQDPWRRDESPEEAGEPPLTGEVIDAGSRVESPGWDARGPFGDQEGVGGWLFGPRSFGGGRVQVYGCSPGCIILSCLVSLVASILLTLLLNWIF